MDGDMFSRALVLSVSPSMFTNPRVRASHPPQDKKRSVTRAATIIQKYTRRMIVLNKLERFPLDPYLTFQTTCHWCGIQDEEDVSFVKSYQLFGCRECVSECEEAEDAEDDY
jgi:hypothetical protein